MFIYHRVLEAIFRYQSSWSTHLAIPTSSRKNWPKLGPCGKAQEPRHQRKDGDQGHVAPKDFGGLQVVNMGPPVDGIGKSASLFPRKRQGQIRTDPRFGRVFSSDTFEKNLESWDWRWWNVWFSEFHGSKKEPQPQAQATHVFSMKLGTTSNVREGTCHTASLINKNHQHWHPLGLPGCSWKGLGAQSDVHLVEFAGTRIYLYICVYLYLYLSISILYIIYMHAIP